MTAVARAGPHRGVKDDEVVAHYAREGEASPGLVCDRSACRRGGRSAATTVHPTNAAPEQRQASTALLDDVPMTVPEPPISVVPANEASCADLRALFGVRGAASWCQCQRYKLRPRESFRSFPVEERVRRLHEQTACGHAESGTTSGLVAYRDREPVGWCAVEERSAYEGLLRAFRVPWDGRDEDRTDGR